MAITEAEIVRACKQRDTNGQRYLYLHYAPMLKSLCMRYTKDAEKADDVLHDAFIKIYNNIGSYKGDGVLAAWMKRIVVNTALDSVNATKKKFESELADEFPEEDTEDDSGLVTQLIDAGFTKNMLLGLLRQLPDNYAVVFNLFYIDELSHKEIGKLLDISEGNSRKIAFRAKEKMKGLICENLNKETLLKR